MARYLIKPPSKCDPVTTDNWRSVTAMEKLLADLNSKVNSTTGGLSAMDGKLKVAKSDLVSDYLNKKLIAGTGITLTKSNTGGMGSEIITAAIGAHADLTDMPDTGGTNTDHDARYVTQVSASAPTVPTPYEGMRWYDTDAIQGGYNINVTIVTDTYIILSTDDLVVCNKTTAFTVTLPVASGGGRLVYIKNINTGMVTVDGDGTDTIDGITTQTLSQWDAITICDYAANKWVIL